MTPGIEPSDRFVVEPSTTLAGRWQVRDTVTGQVARTHYGALSTTGNLAVYADRAKADDFARRANDERLQAKRSARQQAAVDAALERAEARTRKAG